MRAFIAVEIPLQIRQTIQDATSPLRKELGPLIRWVSAENTHLTLKFLGDVSPTNTDMLTQMMRVEADACAPFDIRLTGIGSFPGPKRVRVIYIGIQAPAGLDALQRGIQAAARRLGYESEARRFSPHLTVGRVKQNATVSDQERIRRALENIRIDSLGTARVDSVHLFKSDLKPTGSLYTKLFSAYLKQAP